MKIVETQKIGTRYIQFRGILSFKVDGERKQEFFYFNQKNRSQKLTALKKKILNQYKCIETSGNGDEGIDTQFIGVSDKNCEKIFEGDLVRTNANVPIDHLHHR